MSGMWREGLSDRLVSVRSNYRAGLKTSHRGIFEKGIDLETSHIDSVNLEHSLYHSYKHNIKRFKIE